MTQEIVNPCATMLELRDIAGLYTCCNQKTEQLGLTENKVHKTRLKEQLLAHVPDLQAYKQGREMYLAFNQISTLVLLLQKQLTIIQMMKVCILLKQRLLSEEICLYKCHTSLKEHLNKVVRNLLFQTRL